MTQISDLIWPKPKDLSVFTLFDPSASLDTGDYAFIIEAFSIFDFQESTLSSFPLYLIGYYLLFPLA